MPLIRVGLCRIGALLISLTAVGCALTSPASGPAVADPSSAFVVSRADFEHAFPNRLPFYTYDDFVAASALYPAFATTGDDATRRREGAAFLGNVYHETGGLTLIDEAVGRRQIYCDSDKPYGCPAGKDAYYGRGPGQLSWNYNYRWAGDALGVDLLADPQLLSHDSALAWKAALWFWNTQAAAAAATPHDAMVHDLGFGQTIRAFNGAQECDGGNRAQVQSRVDAYRRISALLGVSPGENLYC